MKKLLAILMVVICLLSIPFGVFALDVEIDLGGLFEPSKPSGTTELTPDDEGYYSVTLSGKTDNEYVILVIRGEFDKDSYVSAAQNAADEDILYFDQGVADENGKVNFTFLPKSYDRATVVIGGTDLSEPVLAGYLNVTGISDVAEIRVSGVNEKYTVNGYAGADIVSDVSYSVYDTFGNRNDNAPAAQITLSPADSMASYDNASGKLTVNSFAGETVNEYTLKFVVGDVEKNVTFKVERAQPVTNTLKLYTSQEHDKELTSTRIDGIESVFGSVTAFPVSIDQFGNQISDDTYSYYINDVPTDSATFTPTEAGNFTVTVKSDIANSVSASYTVNVTNRPKYDGGALALSEAIDSALAELDKIGTEVLVSDESGDDVYADKEWTTQSNLDKFIAATEKAKSVLASFDAGTATDTNARSASSTLVSAQKTYLYNVKNGKRVDAQSITINEDSVTLAYGKSVTLKATLAPYGNTDKVTWSSSDEQIATVTSAGVVTARGNGNVTITASTRLGLTAVCDVYAYTAATKITLSETSLAAVVGGEPVKLECTMFGENVTDRLIWSSSNEDVAVVDNDGNVTAVAKGSAKIYAKTDSGKSAYCTVSVGLPADIVSFASFNTSLAKDKYITLKATASREDKQTPISTAVSFSIISQKPDVEGKIVATLDNGKLTGVNTGVVTVRATALATLNKASADIVINVCIPASTVKLAYSSMSMVVGGETRKPEVTVLPVENTDVLFWTSSNEDVATVDENGVVTAVGMGSAKITVKSGSGKSANLTVKVGVPADMVTITIPKTTSVAVGKSVTLKATAAREDKVKPISTGVIWESSDESIATVNAGGKVTGVSTGKVTITARAEATLNDAFDEIELNICILATKVTLSQTKANMCVGGDDLNLNATVLPENNTDTLIWYSSDDEVATVDENGTVTAISAGSAKIYAKTGSGKSVYCTVKVGVPADMVTITIPKTTSVAVGKSVTLKATAAREDKVKPISTGVIWESSDESIATVNAGGKVTGVSTGKVTITARAEATLNDAFDEIELNICILATKVTLSQTKASMCVGGDNLNLNATVLPENNTDTLIWYSSNEDVATVDENGTVTAVGAGSAKIYAKTGSGKSVYCTVTVGLASDKVTITVPSTASVADGKYITLKAVAAREDGVRPVSNAVIWESSDESIATVDAKGKVIGISPGKVTITARAEATLNGASDSIEITVVPVLYKVTLSDTAMNLTQDTETNIAHLLTAYTSTGEVIDLEQYCDVTYKSSYSARVSVADDGTIYGLAKGYSNITFTVKCGSVSKTATVKVTVVEPVVASLSGNEEITESMPIIPPTVEEAGELPEEAVEEPTETVETPVETVEEPTETVEAPVETTEQVPEV